MTCSLHDMNAFRDAILRTISAIINFGVRVRLRNFWQFLCLVTRVVSVGGPLPSYYVFWCLGTLEIFLLVTHCVHATHCFWTRFEMDGMPFPPQPAI